MLHNNIILYNTCSVSSAARSVRASRDEELLASVQSGSCETVSNTLGPDVNAHVVCKLRIKLQ